MKTAAIILAFLFSAFASTVDAQSDPNAAVVAEVKTFYDSYAEDLRLHRREAIGNRYDGRGVYLLGNGAKALESLEETRRYYLKNWIGPKAFNWKDMEFEVITPKAVLVLARFEWQTEKEPKPTVCSYSGLVQKSASGKWLIRVEDESCPPPK